MSDAKLGQTRVIRFTTVIIMLMAISLPVSAELFVGVDATDLKVDLRFQNGTDHYDLNPGRLRVGWLGKYGGIELHALADNDDTITSFAGVQTNYEIENAYGLFFHFHDDYGYIRVGGMWMDTAFSLVSPSIVDESSVFLRSVGLGLEYEMLPHLKLHVDYTYMAGRTDYPTLVSGTGNTGIRMTGFGAGVTFAF